MWGVQTKDGGFVWVGSNKGGEKWLGLDIFLRKNQEDLLMA